MTDESKQQPGVTPENAPATESRRRALARLGLTAAAVYATPTILRIDRSARGQFLTPCEDGPDVPPGDPLPPPCPDEDIPPGFPIPP